MKKMMAALLAMMITMSGCSAVSEKEEPADTKETRTAVTAPVGHWMAVEPNSEYPYVLILENGGTGKAFGTEACWMLKGDILYLECIGLGRIKGEMTYQLAENGFMFLDGHPYMPWKIIKPQS